MKKYVIASSNDWFFERLGGDSLDREQFELISAKNELNSDYLNKLKPRFVFFPHWSHIIPSEIYENFECIVFHTAPLPYGRGGSPIQNLILENFNTSPVCALKVIKELDAGPIYTKREISLEGRLEKIFDRIFYAIHEMIIEIIELEPTPIEQSGEEKKFKRKRPKDSCLPLDEPLEKVFDRIRMVDGAGYPRAYIHYGSYKIEFERASFSGNEIQAQVRIYKS